MLQAGLVRESAEQLSLVVLKVGVADRLILKLHSSLRYMVKSAYNHLTTSDFVVDDWCNHVLWLKQIPLKVNIFIWSLFINRLATKMIMFRRNILDYNDTFWSTACGLVGNQDHLFFSYVFYGQLWLLISGWLGISTTHQGSLFDYYFQFGGLEGFSNESRLAFNTIWISVLFTIWKDRNRRHFHNKMEQLLSLLEKAKLQAYWWLISYYILFYFEYSIWRLNHSLCFQVVT